MPLLIINYEINSILPMVNTMPLCLQGDGCSDKISVFKREYVFLMSVENINVEFTFPVTAKFPGADSLVYIFH